MPAATVLEVPSTLPPRSAPPLVVPSPHPARSLLKLAKGPPPDPPPTGWVASPEAAAVGAAAAGAAPPRAATAAPPPPVGQLAGALHHPHAGAAPPLPPPLPPPPAPTPHPPPHPASAAGSFSDMSSAVPRDLLDRPLTVTEVAHALWVARNGPGGIDSVIAAIEAILPLGTAVPERHLRIGLNTLRVELGLLSLSLRQVVQQAASLRWIRVDANATRVVSAVPPGERHGDGSTSRKVKYGFTFGVFARPPLVFHYFRKIYFPGIVKQCPLAV
eukprot:gene11237-biopygen13259